MAHIFFVPKARIDAIERTSILLRLARRIFGKVGTQGFFGSLNKNSEPKFGYSKWGIYYGGYEIEKMYFIRMKIVTWEFLSSLSTTNLYTRHSKTQYSNRKNYLIGIKTTTQEFSRSLITNRHSKFKNSIWRI